MTVVSACLRWLLASALLLGAANAEAQVRLADDTDRAAFRDWFTLLADLQFEQPAAEVTDCAALIRFAFREALRTHGPEWSRRLGLPFTPRFADVRSAPRANEAGWPLFRIDDGSQPRYGEFADAQTIVARNAVAIGRDRSRARPGDLLYFRQPSQSQPDHLMVVIGRSHFDPEGSDWVVYHTGPSAESPGEVRKVRLATLAAHPAARWRPVAGNQHFVGVFRLAALTP